MYKCIISMLLLCVGVVESSLGQELNWDNTSKDKWHSEFKKVIISSSVDSTTQHAYFRATTLSTPQPLVVSLHSWSGNYEQPNPLVNEIALRNLNFIQPDFRGPNNRIEACCSEKVIADIEDAIAYVLKNSNVNPDEVHIIGSSGGGYATLMCYMMLKYPVKSFSAWVPISDLEAWYWQSVGRRQKYANDILLCTSSSRTEGLNVAEARRRSPLYVPFDKELRQSASLHIYAGIHDGYTGSVPMTHSIRMFNRIAEEWSPTDQFLQVSEPLISELVTARTSKEECVENIGKHTLHLHRINDKVELALFEGGHEQIVDQAISLIPIQQPICRTAVTILTLGDSNGENTLGWPRQLSMLMPYSKVINRSKAGRTIGHSNGGREELNGLLSIEPLLETIDSTQRVDFIVVCLGTNDAKAEFQNSTKLLEKNLTAYIQKIKKSALYKRCSPKIIVVTPPPVDEKRVDQSKYGGAARRLDAFQKEFRKVALAEKVALVDVYSSIASAIDTLTTDGVHFTPQGMRMIAIPIVDILTK